MSRTLPFFIRRKFPTPPASDRVVKGYGRAVVAAEGLDLANVGDAQPPPGNAALVRRFAAGEREAFEQVVERYQSRVQSLARRLLGWRDGEAHDAVQDVFLAALRNAGRVRGRDGELWPWLARITVNTCRSHQRRTWTRLRFLRRAKEAAPAQTAPAADEAMAGDETGRRVREAVARLPARDREVVVLHHLEDMRPTDIAEVLGVSVNAVEVRLHRARAKLKEHLLADEETNRET